MKRRSVLTGFGSLAVGSVLPSLAWADEKGDKALVALDASVWRAKTQFYEYDVLIKTPDKPDRKLGLAVYIKGEWRYSEFLAPADVKGTKVLILSPSQMYVYLPAYKKVRRIASHTTDQGFMGMNFSQDDMSITSYAKYFHGQITSDDGKLVKYTLTKKKDSEAAYPKVELVVEKARNLPIETKYFSDSGTHIKTETRSNYTEEKGHFYPKDLKMIDHTKGGQYTTLTVKTAKVNHDIPDSRFSKRALEDGS